MTAKRRVTLAPGYFQVTAQREESQAVSPSCRDRERSESGKATKARICRAVHWRESSQRLKASENSRALGQILICAK